VNIKIRQTVKDEKTLMKIWFTSYKTQTFTQNASFFGTIFGESFLQDWAQKNRSPSRDIGSVTRYWNVKIFFFRLHRENGNDYYCKLPAARRVEHTNSWLKRNRSFCPFIVDVPTSGDGTTAICFDGIRHRSGKADSIQHCFLEISVGQENSFSNFYN
jgi:hypothetical protein